MPTLPLDQPKGLIYPEDSEIASLRRSHFGGIRKNQLQALFGATPAKLLACRSLLSASVQYEPRYASTTQIARILEQNQHLIHRCGVSRSLQTWST